METLKASQVIKAIQDSINEFGDLPVYISDGQGELKLTSSCIRFSNTIGFKEKRDSKDMKTTNGRFFVLSDL